VRHAHARGHGLTQPTARSKTLCVTTPILQVRDATKSLGEGERRNRVLQGLSFDVQPGEFISVVGPSGCGKTTLLMALAGLYPLDGGEVLFEGRAVREPMPGMAVVFQDYSRSLLPWKGNLDNVVFGMQRVDAPPAGKAAHARDLLEAVGLTGFERHYPWQVSGGMQQRVAIARALAAQPRLLLLDEPLAAVDAQTRADLQDLLLQLAQRFSQTCVLVTHDVEEAVYLADRVVVLSQRPTRVTREIDVPLPRPRDQLSTREDPLYLQRRHEVLSIIRALRSGAAADPVPSTDLQKATP
jgi:NitT/TauT family transport system ATP-binding protein